jgi:MprA protease rhombosortase-interaction domain-containing protein
MTDSTAVPQWTDHNVSDPGITLVQALMYTIGAVVLAAAGAAVFRRRRRAGSTRRT